MADQHVGAISIGTMFLASGAAMTAFTTLPSAPVRRAPLLSRSGDHIARPARRPVEPPSGRYHLQLACAGMSATSSIVLIITAICNLPVDHDDYWRR